MLNEIFAHLIPRKAEDENVMSGYTYLFLEQFPSTEFDGEDLIFYRFMEYIAKLEIPIREKYFHTFLQSDLRSILEEENIHISGCEGLNFKDPTLFEQAVLVTRETMIEQFKDLMAIETSAADFKVAIDEFIKERLIDRTRDIMERAFERMSDKASAYDGVEYLSSTLDIVRTIYNPAFLTELEGTEILEKDSYKICDWGLEALDHDSGGIYTRDLVNIGAAPGVGKTRLALGCCAYNALINGHSVLHCAGEQPVNEVKSHLIARHVYTLYNKIIDAKMIKDNRVPDELISMVKSAELDLFESGKYGKFYCIYEVLYYETFIQRIKTLDKLYGPFNMVIIDYMGLIEQKGGKYSRHMEEFQVISDSYKLFKRYITRYNKSGIAVGQFNQKGIDASSKDEAITPDMLQGGIGPFRHINYDVSISMTPQMKVQNKRRLSQAKVRDTEGFGSVMADVRLACDFWYQSKQLTT